MDKDKITLKSRLIKETALKTYHTQDDVKPIINAFIDLIIEDTVKTGKVSISGFGVDLVNGLPLTKSTHLSFNSLIAPSSQIFRNKSPSECFSINSILHSIESLLNVILLSFYT